MNKKDVIIQTKKLCKSFKNDKIEQVIIKDLDLKIYKNDFTIIMGSSGAGKSTLMYSLSGMDKPTSGNVIFADFDITKMKDDKLAIFRRKNCGFVFQQIYMLEKMSLMDNALTAGLLVDNNKKKIIQNAKELFKKVNIPEETYKKSVNQVSGGEASRAGIVRAAINKPSVIFADEPTGALDSETSNEIMSLLKDLNNQGKTIIMVTHDADLIKYATKVVRLKDGVLYEEAYNEYN